MVLPYERDRHPGNRVARVRLEPEEFDRGAKRREIHRKRWRQLLTAQRLLERRVTAVDAQAVAGNVGGCKKREPHDVVPMHVRHEDVIRLRRLGAMARQRGFAERSDATAKVAQNVVRFARLDLDARRMAAVGSADVQVQPIDVIGDVAISDECTAVGAA